MALTDLAQPDDDTHNLMRVAQEEIPDQTAAAAVPLVKHDDGLPELEVEVPELDFDNTRCFEVESKVESKVESEVESKVEEIEVHSPPQGSEEKYRL